MEKNLPCDGPEESRLLCAAVSPNILFKVASQGRAVKVVALSQSREKRCRLCSQKGLGARKKMFQNKKGTIWKCKRKWRCWSGLDSFAEGEASCHLSWYQSSTCCPRKAKRQNCPPQRAFPMPPLLFKFLIVWLFIQSCRSCSHSLFPLTPSLLLPDKNLALSFQKLTMLKKKKHNWEVYLLVC